jgi:hypothetical protein
MFGPSSGPGGTTPRKPFNGHRVMPATLPARTPDRMAVVQVLVRRACMYLARFGAPRAGPRWSLRRLFPFCLGLRTVVCLCADSSAPAATRRAALEERGLFHRAASEHDDTAVLTQWFTESATGARR